MDTISDANPWHGQPPRPPGSDRRSFGRLLTVLGITAALGIGWWLSSLTTVVDATAVGVCLLASAHTAVRIRQCGSPALVSSLSMASVTVSLLLTERWMTTSLPIERSVLVLVAASGLWLSMADEGELSRSPLLHHVFASSWIMAALSGGWLIDDGLELDAALRVMAAVVSVNVAITGRRRTPVLALGIVMTVGAVGGIDGLGVRLVEPIALAGAGALIIVRWWLPTPRPVPVRAEGSTWHAPPLRSFAVEGGVLLTVSPLLALLGHEDAAAVTLSGLLVGATISGAGWLWTAWEHRADNESLERVAQELARRAQIDALTGLPNRLAFDLRLAEETERALRHHQPLALCFVDIDRFKSVNDTYGHQVGDALLVRVAETLRSTARTFDLVCRYGGEEFVVIAPTTGAIDALFLAERLRKAVSSMEIAGLGRRVTLSLGVAGLPEHATTAATLLQRTDDALYEAKRSGRDRSSVYRRDELIGRG